MSLVVENRPRILQTKDMNIQTSVISPQKEHKRSDTAMNLKIDSLREQLLMARRRTEEQFERQKQLQKSHKYETEGMTEEIHFLNEQVAVIKSFYFRNCKRKIFL